MAAPELYLLASAATTQTQDTIAAANIESRMTSAFNTMVQAWQYAQTTMWYSGLNPDGVADAFGDYGKDWFELFNSLQTLLNEYIPAADDLAAFTPSDYQVNAAPSGHVTILLNNSGQVSGQ